MTDTLAPSKICRDCTIEKPLLDFPRYSGLRSHKPICRECARKIDREHKAAKRKVDPEYNAKILQRNKTYREKYSEGYAAHRINKREKYKSSYFSDLKFRCRQLVSSSRRRAAKKGLEFEITEDLIFALIHSQNFKCAVTGTKFELGQSVKYCRSPVAPSIDRKDSDGGYTLDNIQVVAAWYNLMKNEWSDEDVASFIHTAYHSIFGVSGHG